MKSEIIFLDNASTTKIDQDVLIEIIPYMTELYANPSSSHIMGVRVNEEIKKARENVANLLNTKPSQITFTSGATEALNTIIKGIVSQNRSIKNQIITVSTEHSAVLETCKFLEQQGVDVTYLPVLPTGLIDLNVFRELISDKTLLVIAMLVNNETGVIQPIKEIVDICHEYNAFCLSDTTQAVGKIPVDVEFLDIDFIVFSGHKFHGPKGVGGYYSKEGSIKFDPLIHGGGQEAKKRSGTLNVPGIIGLGKSCEIAMNQSRAIELYTKELLELLEEGLLTIEGAFINGDKQARIFNISNICFPGIEADVFIQMLDNICVSNGSACHSALIEPSHVLKEMGLNDRDAFSSIRFSLSKYNTKEEIVYTIGKIKELIQ